MSTEKKPRILTPEITNELNKIYHQFLHPPSKYSSSPGSKNDVVFASEVGSRFITGTIIGSVLDFLHGPTPLPTRTRWPIKPASRKPASRFERGLLGLRGADRSARMGRFLGLFSMGSESLSYAAFVLRGRRNERWLVDDVVANVVTSGTLLACHGLRPAAAAAVAVAFGVYTVADSGARVLLDRSLSKSKSKLQN